MLQEHLCIRLGCRREVGWHHLAPLSPPAGPLAPDQGPCSLSQRRHLQENFLLNDKGAEDGWSGLLLVLACANVLMVCKWLPIDEVSS